MTTIERIPVVSTGQALQSLRSAGYSLPAAIGEVVDNSLEADANQILIRLDEGEVNGRKRVHRLVFSDDGTGMEPDVLQHYLQLGFSTRFMRTDTIGKFGVGAKLAALNFGTRIDVWSRTTAGDPFLHVYFDLDEALEAEKDGDMIGIDPPKESRPGEDLLDMLPSGTGTLVVWSKVDQLEHGRRAKNFNELRLEVEKELSRIFRDPINDGIDIYVNDLELFPHDPLFLMEDTWATYKLTEYYERGEGASQQPRPNVPADFLAEIIAREEIQVAGHTVVVTVTLLPRSVTRKRGGGGDKLARDLRIPENQGSISFMRLNREISYTNVPRIFPRGVTDPDRWIGIEVSFMPDLDEYFGVRNVKRGAEPADDLREKIRSVLKKAIPTARLKLDAHWGEAAQKSRDSAGEHGAVMEAAGQANRTMPKARADGEEDPDRVYDDLATDVLGPEASEDARKSYVTRVKELPFVVESVDFPGKQFLEVQHVNGSVIIRLNTRHRFYREMWEPLKAIAESDPGTIYPIDAVHTARRTIEAMTLLLIAYGKAESMHENPVEQYGELRDYWGMFLDTMLSKVKDVL